eukprot:m.52634 g.52634  ORF g.52634 m.52634 type:complete len:505 (+) comp10807_c0_seq1:193-1707(+)
MDRDFLHDYTHRRSSPPHGLERTLAAVQDGGKPRKKTKNIEDLDVNISKNEFTLSEDAGQVLKSAKKRAKYFDRGYISADDIVYAVITEEILQHRYQENDAKRVLKLAQKSARDAQDDMQTNHLLQAGMQVWSENDAYNAVFQRGEIRSQGKVVALSENSRLALMGTVNNAIKKGSEKIGTEDILRALFQNTKEDARARYWTRQESFRSLFEPERSKGPAVVETPGRMLFVGGLAGAVEVACMQPFVYWKNMEQIQQPMSWRPSAAYRGVFMNAASIAPITAIQYAANGWFSILYRKNTKKQTIMGYVGCAALAGAVSSVIVTPAELVVLSQQRTGLSVAATLQEIVRAKGLAGTMRGFSATTAREIGWTVGFLGCTPIFKSTLQEDSKFFRRNDIAASVASSLAAGQVAAILTQPFDAIKSLIQADRGIHNPMQFKNTLAAVKALYASSGLSAFWRGLVPRSWRLCGAVFILGETQMQLSKLLDRFGLLLPPRIEAQKMPKYL